ncbi:hypothetical protein K438DRAFT_1754321 [Mycena galopus ATCC 62051]|nr:hypothetical protein K438DRAFT_1754321 [Mycena galopus ATCC 62051]
MSPLWPGPESNGVLLRENANMYSSRNSADALQAQPGLSAPAPNRCADVIDEVDTLQLAAMHDLNNPYDWLEWHKRLKIKTKQNKPNNWNVMARPRIERDTSASVHFNVIAARNTDALQAQPGFYLLPGAFRLNLSFLDSTHHVGTWETHVPASGPVLIPELPTTDPDPLSVNPRKIELEKKNGVRTAPRRFYATGAAGDFKEFQSKEPSNIVIHDHKQLEHVPAVELGSPNADPRNQI